MDGPLTAMKMFRTCTWLFRPSKVLAYSTCPPKVYEADTGARATMAGRLVVKSVASVEQHEGVGARVRRGIGRHGLRNLDPFLMMDEFRTTPGSAAGFPDHPHRGFETVTYLLSGAFTHEDFCGRKGTLHAGDLQWMTAGRGVVHSEMPVNDAGPAHGLQLWVNLRASDKMVEPAYQELRAADIPKATRDGVTVIVVSGEALGQKSKVYTRTPTMYLDFRLAQGATHSQPVPQGWTGMVYTLAGSVTLGPVGAEQRVEAHHTVVLGDGDHVIMQNQDREEAHFVLVAGEPLKEPIVQHGPFVMNTQEEIEEAISDFRNGTNGFERAKGWKSQNGNRQ
ncbi:pirin isoform X1 [Petromyzon marinus]|uniref:Pirin n=2 Tax=Petromyzon marinus TaxID=7757 RepID=A0AAJ7WWG6_PETMA|nr:pirin isoform X1 [Petromyzon marinus]